MYLFLAPIYLFKSGLPQPGDVFILVLLPAALKGWDGALPRDSATAVRALLLFTIWACALNWGWAIATGTFDVFGRDTFLLFPVYYVYNTLIVVVALVLYRRYGDLFLRTTLYAVLATVYLQLTSAFLLSGEGRGSLFFNNPNQLGYYALIASTLITLLHARSGARLLLSTSGLVACAFLALTSASRAAVAGVCILIALLLFANPRLIVLTCIIAVAAAILGGPVDTAIESTQSRIERSRGSKVGFLEERGYDRLWTYREYVPLGAGEGGLYRFAGTSKIRTRKGEPVAIEIHSSFATILFCYGLPGAILFVLFLYRVVRGANLRAILMLTPVMFYTVAHQGLRFTTFWILMAVFVMLKTPSMSSPSRSI